jgi:hypothetical protein
VTELELKPAEEASPAPAGVMESTSLFHRLRLKYPAEAYALFTEVRNATGFKGDRAADAVAMSLYPSRGLEIFGFEFKASRSDWLRELKDPRKAEGVCRFCDRWWIVTTAPDIVKRDELPKTWGLMVCTKEGDGLRIVVPAPALEPTPLDRAFTASLLRAAQKAGNKPLEKIRQEERDKAYHEYAERQQAADKRASEKYSAEIRDLQENIRAFEAASGVRIRGQAWNMGRIGAAVSAIIDSPVDVHRRLAALADRATEIATEARAGAEALKALEGLPSRAADSDATVASKET